MPELPDFAHDPLTPVRFLQRSGRVFPDRTAIVDGDRSFTHAQLLDRSRRWAGMLRAAGVHRGERVAVLAPNSHVLLEAHTGPAMAGVVLVALNTRLAAREHAAILDASGARWLVATDELFDTARAAVDHAAGDVELVDERTLEQRLAAAEPLDEPVDDETDLISLNYTSGTTGTPKGVMYHHRGAFLQALAMVAHAGLDVRSRYLWTLPQFHCNGWAFTWAVTAAGGTHVCLRELDPAAVWDELRAGTTHFCGAPTVLTMIANAENAAPLDTPVRGFTGGAPPTPAILEELGELHVEVTHLYGLTESYGPAVICDWHPGWDDLSATERAELAARQGVGNVLGGEVRVVATDGHGEDVARDGQEMGEILLRGNCLMAGYLDDPEATAEATWEGDWFRTGDLAVVHDDGYVEIRDRAKDVIVSGGENISSVEVERVLARHPAVLEAAVVGVPHDHWGERPRAHVTLREGATATPDELRDHVRDHLAGFKVPDDVVLGPLPTTSTGKVQKHVLRSRQDERA